MIFCVIFVLYFPFTPGCQCSVVVVLLSVKTVWCDRLSRFYFGIFRGVFQCDMTCLLKPRCCSQNETCFVILGLIFVQINSGSYIVYLLTCCFGFVSDDRPVNIMKLVQLIKSLCDCYITEITEMSFGVILVQLLWKLYYTYCV